MARKPKLEELDDVSRLRAEFPDGIEAEPTVAPAPDGVKVMLLCKSVFLPDNPMDEGWAGSQSTRKYQGETDNRRTRLTVHPTLAEFLQDRKQAEILD